MCQEDFRAKLVTKMLMNNNMIIRVVSLFKFKNWAMYVFVCFMQNRTEALTATEALYLSMLNCQICIFFFFVPNVIIYLLSNTLIRTLTNHFIFNWEMKCY